MRAPGPEAPTAAVDAFVGGVHLVHAVTQGPADELLYGNFPNYNRYPAV